MVTGRIKFVINCIASRFEKVVLPEDDGPDIKIIRAPSPSRLRLVISSAILLIFFSCKASETLIKSVA